MPNRSTLDNFHNSWNQTAAWAQSKGVKYNDYYPIYQQDTQRLLQHGSPMSQADRERAVLAAGNVNVSTQKTPGTASNPSNVIGNTVTDLRNIFTGIGDIFIHPLHNGLVDSLKNTVDTMTGKHVLQGPNPTAQLGDALTSTVLSWIPGLYDIGTVLKADNGNLAGSSGLGLLAEHPVNSILDLLPLAKPLSLVKDPATAGRVGMTLEQAQNATVGRVAKGYLMNTLTGKVGPGGLMSVGDRFHAMTGGSILNLNPTIAEAAKGVEITNAHHTAIERHYFTEYERVSEKLSDGQKEQLKEVFSTTDPSNLRDRINDPELDPKVKAAALALEEGPFRFHKEMALAAEGGVTRIRNPTTGHEDVYSVSGHAQVIRARDEAAKAEAKVVEKLPEFEQLHAQTVQAGKMFESAVAQLEQANQAARNVSVEGNVAVQTGNRFNKSGDLARVQPRPAGISKTRIAEDMFGTGGKIDKLLAKAKEGRFEDTKKIADNWLRRMDKWGVDSVDVSADPAFQAVRAQVEKIGKVASVMVELRKRSSRMVHGSGKEWRGDKGFRDDHHAQEAKQLAETHKREKQKFIDSRKETFNRLKTAFVLKKQEIRTRYATAKKQRDAFIADQTRIINEKYGIEKAKVETRHLLARETHTEWVKGRRAQGLPGATDAIQAAQEGTRLQPGALGTREAIRAAHDSLEAQRVQELRAVEKSVPSIAELNAKMQAELRTADLVETQMSRRLNEAYTKQQKQIAERHQAEAQALKQDHVGKKAREGEISRLFREAQQAQRDFADAVWKHPSDNNVDLYFQILTKHIMANEKATETLGSKEKVLAERYGWTQEHIEQIRSNPQIMSQLVQEAVRAGFDDPLFKDMDPKIVEDAQQSARAELATLNKAGIFPPYVPHVSETQLRADATGSYGIRVVVQKGHSPKPDVFSPRTWGMDSSKHDLMAGIHHGVKQMLDQAAIKDYVSKYLSPRMTTEAVLTDTLRERFPSEIAGLTGQGLEDWRRARLRDWNLVEIDPKARFGMTLPEWGDQKLYIDRDLIRAVEKLTSGGLPTAGVFDKATRLFRYSILGLSPRYTAHIVFGGTFLLALREPLFFMHINQALKDLKAGQTPEGLLTHPTNLGTTDYQLSSKKDDVFKAFHQAGGKQSVHLMAQEHIEVTQKIKLAAAQPLHWLKAIADLNLHFTAFVTDLQRSTAALSGMARAGRHGLMDEHGNFTPMTRERQVMEGMHAAEKVMGDLRRMSPFERQVARRAMPFYGWQKHILQYVLSFPGDHPWRAMMLAQMAEYDTEHSPGGLPSRYQFLFFLGKPDAQGNVSALDLRAINPLRDVANYATWGGIISALNPVITAGFSAVDPSITFGGNQLYPKLTYDQFYGIEKAGPQGNLLTSAAAVVPEITAMQNALTLAGQRQNMPRGTLEKHLFESLNFPWVPQQLNLKQEAARTAIAQYHVTASLAKNAWQTGDFSQIADLGAVPDPRNPDYETPVSTLQQLYDELSKQYPGVPPSTVAQKLPALHL